MRFFCTARVTNEGMEVRSGYLPFRTNASTLSIMPRRSSSRDVGTSSYRYHTATMSSLMKDPVECPFLLTGKINVPLIKLNLVAQQLMRVKAYCVHLSFHDLGD
ncbi:hypothetical protein TNCV_1510811 [Trichonephila clavipes]|nr:hypothetical protein TNCV_1510811 [Trichonephila clavipes]